MIKIATIVALLSLVMISSSALSEGIYTWVDENGKTHYSSTPRKNAKKAQLPKIARENLNQKIKQIKEATPPNCLKHGGADCAQGADEDGSVICLDGFKGAKLPYRFHCLEVRIRPSEVQLHDNNQEVLGVINRKAPINKQIYPELHNMILFISLRNSSSVDAFGVEVSFTAGEFSAPLPGPKNIEAFGIAEYSIPLSEFISETDGKKIADILYHLQYRISCTNCKTTIKGRA